MASFEEILPTNEMISLDTLNKKLPDLSARAVALKSEIIEYIQDVENRYENRPKNIKQCLANASKQTKAFGTIKASIRDDLQPQIAITKNSISNHQKRLNTINIHLALCKNLCTIHESINAIEQHQLNDEFEEALKKIETLMKFIEIIPPEENIPVLSNLLNKTVIIKTEIINRFNNVISDSFKTSEEGSNSYKIIVRNCKDLKRAFKIASEHQDNIVVLDNIVRFMWDNIFSAIVMHSSKIVLEETHEEIIFTLHINKEVKDGYLDVFDNLGKFCEFLKQNFDYDLAEGTVLEFIGMNIRDNLSELIIKFCLEDTIPATADGLQKYNEVIKNTEKLQEMFVKTQIFCVESTSILEYANNVDILFINKKCKEYSNLALEIMRKDLHEIVTVGIAIDPSKLAVDNFPQCAISKNVLELINLVEKIMQKATTSSDVSAGRLYTTVKNILFQYAPFVMEHHQKLLQTIPQQVAIYYNNCIYLNYDLGLEKWRDFHAKLPKTLSPERAQFESIRKRLQLTVDDLFNSYVAEQIKQIEETVKNAGIDASPWCEKLSPSSEKSIRQCLRQQELLKTVWQKVLNYYVYNKTMGDLLDSLCKALCKCILQLEDIASDAAEQLVDILKVVLTRGPKLFTEPKEINMFVTNWHKLSELVFVLSSGLEDIRDRWADGKGPLALQFIPDDLKTLIRALFQNTDRRAALLTNISSTYGR